MHVCTYMYISTGVVGASYVHAGHGCTHWAFASNGVLLLVTFWLLAPLAAGRLM